MRKKIFYFLFLTVAVFGFWTCDKDNNDTCSAAWGTELSNEISAMTNAAQVYAANPTTSTCNAYKSAMQDYLDALEPYGNCATLTGTDRVAWQSAVDDAQASINNMDCSSAN